MTSDFVSGRVMFSRDRRETRENRRRVGCRSTRGGCCGEMSEVDTACIPNANGDEIAGPARVEASREPGRFLPSLYSRAEECDALPRSALCLEFALHILAAGSSGRIEEDSLAPAHENAYGVSSLPLARPFSDYVFPRSFARLKFHAMMVFSRGIRISYNAVTVLLIAVQVL